MKTAWKTTSLAQQGTHTFCRRAALAVIIVLLCLAQRVALAADALTAAMRDDAELADVTFVDSEHGWAVGDRGVIWHTLDGGRHWAPQESGVTCRLNTVQFVDAQRGWAGGGTTEPYTHVSRGVLLMTRDGGRTWFASRQPLLGALLRLKFFDARRGWALAQPTPFVPSGVMSTDNGGQDWTPLPPSEVPAWSCGDFADPQHGALAADGEVAVIEQGGIKTVRSGSMGLRRPSRLAVGTNGQACLVGEGGRVLLRPDDGGKWRPPDNPPAAAAQFDFQAIAMHGAHRWIAGTPGSRILHTADAGKTWELLSTGATLPIRALAFVDDDHGWAVGACGQILSTSDGGRSWKFQRGESRHAAYLAVFAEADDVPLELLARLSAGEGYYGAVLLLTRRDQEFPSQPPLVTRLREHEALLGAGVGAVSRCWQFPVRQRGLALSAQRTIDAWRALDDGDPAARLDEIVARAVRCWRPEVVLTHGGGPHLGDDGLQQVVNRAVLRGVVRAAEAAPANAAPSGSGLAPWKVHRVLTTLKPEQLGQMTVSSSQLLPQLGRSLADYVAPARGVLQDDDRVPPSSVSLQVAWDDTGQTSGYREVFSGLIVPHGGEARRAALAESGATVEQLRRVADRRQVLQAIVARGGARSGNRATWLSQIGTLINDLDDASAATLLYQLGCRYRAAGQWDLAADTLAQLADKYPAQPAAAAAALWLVQYYASGELAYRATREGKLPTPPVAAEDPHDGSLPWRRQPAAPIPTTVPAPGERVLAPGERVLAPGEPPGVNANGRRTVVAASAVEPRGASVDGDPSARAGSDDVAAARRRLAVQWAARLEEMSPQLAAEPWGTFPRIRALGPAAPPGKAQRLILGLTRSRCRDAWWNCAAGERWLADSRAAEAPPKPVWRCPRAAEKPKLDGKLDEACWRSAGPGGNAAGVELHSSLGDDTAWPAVAQLAYDDEFLYVAVTCRQAPDVPYAAPNQPRVRDADLSAQDRVALTLDIDRDYVSYWRLAFDHRGMTSDDCSGDATWNPTWYVAVATVKNAWTCEAAIPWLELASRAPRPREAWGVGMTRTVPGVGVQSWSTPASAAKVRGEGFGYLLFD